MFILVCASSWALKLCNKGSYHFITHVIQKFIRFSASFIVDEHLHSRRIDFHRHSPANFDGKDVIS